MVNTRIPRGVIDQSQSAIELKMINVMCRQNGYKEIEDYGPNIGLGCR